MNYRSTLFFFLFTIFTNFSHAKISAMFHPYDSTLQEIATWFAKASSRIDIAMYNMETTKKSPVIAYLASEKMQAKIQAKEIKIRVLFEGYGTSEENAAKMTELEKLGVDVRMLRSSKKVHHKFAVIDGDTDQPLLVMGSANWSLSSQNNYNENILFAEDEFNLTKSYQKQFEHLWKYSNEFGHDLEIAPTDLLFPEETGPQSAQAFFNSDNFIFSEKGIRSNTKAEGFRITRQIIRSIDQAEDKIEIATTRFKLRPVYEALVRAAQRGVQIRLILSQDDYETYWVRKKAVLKSCANIFEEKCSNGTSFGGLLAALDLPNVEVRIKYYNLDYREYLSKQMHSKYLIIDGQTLLTGSFNWSVSSENSHIESLAVISGEEHIDLLGQYNHDFERLWNMGRDQYAQVIRQTVSIPRGGNAKCALSPMVLTYAQVDSIVKSFQGKNCE